jgi:hypothetical protein
MKKKLLILVLIAIIIFSGTAFYSSTKASKGYEVNKIGSNIKVKGELIKENQYRFHSNIMLGEKEPLSSSILELNLYAQVEFDNDTNKYVLKNPKLEITPIGCEQYDKQQEYLTPTGYSANYKFGIKPNQSFNQTMAVGYAKLFLNNKNIKINSIKSVNTESKINSISSLKRAKDNNANVAINYNSLEQYFTNWYCIEFNLISDKEGEFIIN